MSRCCHLKCAYQEWAWHSNDCWIHLWNSALQLRQWSSSWFRPAPNPAQNTCKQPCKAPPIVRCYPHKSSTQFILKSTLPLWWWNLWECSCWAILSSFGWSLLQTRAIIGSFPRPGAGNCSWYLGSGIRCPARRESPLFRDTTCEWVKIVSKVQLFWEQERFWSTDRWSHAEFPSFCRQ